MEDPFQEPTTEALRKGHTKNRHRYF